jgi:hypothetical protein
MQGFLFLMKTKQQNIFLGLLIFLLASISVNAQHEHHQQKADTTKRKTASDKMKNMDHSKMDHDMDSMGHTMTHAYSLNLPMTRNSSGTAWQPDATSMYAYMKMTEKWNLMFHGSIFLRYNYQDVSNKGIRSDDLTDRIDAPNWAMMMAQRRIGNRGLLSLSAMISVDALIMGENGYPLLFQTGETADDKPLIDRQHPHDFFSGLSAAYTQMLNEDTDLTLYVGYPGEPALGPPAFMHRISTFNNPDAPLGHHWQDATHITFGVATVGFRYKIMKLEFSSFTGREPDENRYDFDKPRFDSYSYRISVNPNENFSLQISQGFIKSPEALEPEENITRTTASVMHASVLGEKKHMATSIIWGMNRKTGNSSDQSVLIESNLQANKTALYGRYEVINKSAEELLLTEFEEQSFWISAITLGTNYNLATVLNTNLKAGVQGTINFPDKALESYYGKNPVALEVYLRLTPVNTNIYQNRNR